MSLFKSSYKSVIERDKDMKIEKILTMTEHVMRGYIISRLLTAKIPHKITNDYIVTQNEGVLPLVCVHTDIVGNIPPTNAQIFRHKDIVTVSRASRVLGADDRAGIFIALNLLHRKDFNFAFFAQEEVGCKGSTQFAIKEDLYQYSCFIGLDRASRNGKQNIATYGFDNKQLTKLFGYPESIGSLCDASLLSQYSDIACVNLSVGYDNEHSNKEMLDLSLMRETLQVMKEVQIPDKIFNYEEKINRYNWRDYDWSKYNHKDVIDCDYVTEKTNHKYEAVVCDNCGIADILYMVGDMYICETCIPELEDLYIID